MNKLSLFANLLPKIKKWIFPDGKFKETRALILILFFIVIIVSVHTVGFSNVETAINLLDEVSDIIGYSE